MGDKTKGHILCVDDNRDTCEMLAVLLGEAGYDVQYAMSVSEGLTKARQGGFGMILLDWSFADGTGLGLCRQIRAFDQQTAILFYTGENDADAVAAALSAGAQDYLVKPVAVDRLLRAISEYVGDKA